MESVRNDQAGGWWLGDLEGQILGSAWNANAGWTLHAGCCYISLESTAEHQTVLVAGSCDDLGELFAAVRRRYAE